MTTNVKPNLAFRAVREESSYNQLASRIFRLATSRGIQLTTTQTNLARHLKKIEQGAVGCPTSPLLELLCDVTGRTQLELFGRLTSPAPDVETFSITSHKFVPTFIGVEAVQTLLMSRDVTATTVHGMDCYSHEVTSPAALRVTLYLYPFGVALFHIVDRLDFESVSALARWRRQSYCDAMDWTGKNLSADLSTPVDGSYVFSVYWLHHGKWSSETLPAAVRLLSMPEVVFGDDECQPTNNAEAVEETLLRDGFEHPEIVDYGVMGISIAFASWSAVAYHPLAPDRALSPEAHVEVELRTQAVWCYCRNVLDQVEDGRDPEAAADYGWRYLRAMRSKAVSPGSQESTQSLSMRRAIFDTSHLDDQLTSAIECLRDG